MKPPENLGATQTALREIDVLIRARYPVIYLLTHEEGRLEALLHQIAVKQNKQLFTWTATRGLVAFSQNEDGEVVAPAKGEYTDPAEVLQHIVSKNAYALFVLKDFHPFLDDPHIIRRLRDAANELKGTYKNILIVSPRLNLPVELEKEITLIDFPLPDANELTSLLLSVCETVRAKNKSAVNLNNSEAAAMVRAACGLTLTEAENAFAKAVVNDSVIDARDIDLVLKEKQQIIRKSGILEFYPAEAQLDQVGGFLNLKRWLATRAKAFTPQAAAFGLPVPKGVLLLGAPGTGKSLIAKAVAHAWQMPLLRLDFGRIFSGLVGSSEENMRRALRVAESVAPAVLWIDEIEKGLSGGSSGQSDGGTAARVFGTFLTWMQEKTAKVFVVATANRIDALPPELLRRGRFDEVFFMDLPVPSSRQEILEIHLRKRQRSPETFDFTRLLQITEGFSGAELEHCVTEALFRAFHENREVEAADLAQAASELIPLSTTYAEELKRSREWAATRARPADIPVAATSSRNRVARLEVANEKKAV